MDIKKIFIILDYNFKDLSYVKSFNLPYFDYGISNENGFENTINDKTFCEEINRIKEKHNEMIIFNYPLNIDPKLERLRELLSTIFEEVPKIDLKIIIRNLKEDNDIFKEDYIFNFKEIFFNRDYMKYRLRLVQFLRSVITLEIENIIEKYEILQIDRNKNSFKSISNEDALKIIETPNIPIDEIQKKLKSSIKNKQQQISIPYATILEEENNKSKKIWKKILDLGFKPLEKIIVGINSFFGFFEFKVEELGALKIIGYDLDKENIDVSNFISSLRNSKCEFFHYDIKHLEDNLLKSFESDKTTVFLLNNFIYKASNSNIDKLLKFIFKHANEIIIELDNKDLKSFFESSDKNFWKVIKKCKSFDSKNKSLVYLEKISFFSQKKLLNQIDNGVKYSYSNFKEDKTLVEIQNHNKQYDYISSFIKKNFPEKDTTILDINSYTKSKIFNKLKPYYDNIDSCFDNSCNYRISHSKEISEFKFDWYDVVILDNIINQMEIEEAVNLIQYIMLRCEEIIVFIPVDSWGTLDTLEFMTHFFPVLYKKWQVLDGKEKNMIFLKNKEFLPCRNLHKEISFFWAGSELSWLRYMSLYSFRKLNPNWNINLYYSENSETKIKTWDTYEDQDFYNFKGKNFINKLDELNINLIKEDFIHPKTFNSLNNELTPVHKADLFRLKKLYLDGGFYSDLDVLYIKPIDELYEIMKNYDMIMCWTEEAAEKECIANKWWSIGFMAAQKGTSFFKDLWMNANNFNNPNDLYQKLGVLNIDRLLGELSNGFNGIEVLRDLYNTKVFNLPMSYFYPFRFDDVNKIFDKISMIPDESFGIHWFGGNPRSQKENNEINDDNFDKFSNTFTESIKKIESFSKKRDLLKRQNVNLVSIIIPTFGRNKLLSLCLFSLKKQIHNDFDIEIIVIDDNQSDLSIDTKNICKKFNAKYIKYFNKDKDWSGPAGPINFGFKKSKGEIILIMNPETFIPNNEGLNFLVEPLLNKTNKKDEKIVTIPCEFKDDDGSYLESLLRTNKHNNEVFEKCESLPSWFPFLIALRKDSFDSIDGYDLSYSGGIAWEDNDFIEKLIQTGHKFKETKCKGIHLFHSRYKFIPSIFIKNVSIYSDS